MSWCKNSELYDIFANLTFLNSVNIYDKHKSYDMIRNITIFIIT